MKVKLAIIGSRCFVDYELLVQVVTTKFDPASIDLVISGGATGADQLAEQFARDFQIETKIFKANWTKYGKAAGMIRNKDIVREADYVFVFWDGESKGTLNSINLCKRLKVPLEVVLFKSTTQLF